MRAWRKGEEKKRIGVRKVRDEWGQHLKVKKEKKKERSGGWRLSRDAVRTKGDDKRSGSRSDV